MKPSRVMLILSLCLLPSCAPLQPHASAWGDAGEVALRVVACPLTFCMSEVGLYQNAEQEKRQAARARWYRSLTTEQQDREDRHDDAALMGLGMALSGGGGPFALRPAPRPPALRCTSLNMSAMTYTECP